MIKGKLGKVNLIRMNKTKKSGYKKKRAEEYRG